MVTQLIILAMLCAGFYFYIKIAGRNKSDEIVGYFLGGRNVGHSLFEHTTWGTSFSFNNGIYWGLYLGYTLGLSSLWINASWALGFLLLAWMIPRLVKPTGEYTIHGYLGSVYGGKTRVVASIASITAMIFNLGSEIVFASIFLSKILGIENLQVVLIFAFAIFSATYCSIGGYRANAAIDRFQNLFSVAGMLLLFWLLSVSGVPLSTIKIIFLVLGIVFFIAFVKRSIQNTKKVSMLDSVLLLVSVAFFLALICNSDRFGNVLGLKSVLHSVTHPTNTSGIYIVSLIVFQFLYQLVDTVNWQNISAHNISTESKGKIKEMRWALFFSGLKIYIAPIFVTTIIGYLYSILQKQPGEESDFMINMIRAVLPDANTMVSALIFGFFAFAFIGAGLSGVDSWLMAINQTFSWDIRDFKKFQKKEFKVAGFDKKENDQIVTASKRGLFLAAITGAGLYYFLYWISDKKIVPLFFVIFSAALSLLPSLLYALLLSSRSNLVLKRTSGLSIVLGYLAPVLFLVYVFVYGSFTLFSNTFTKDDTYTWAPFLSLGVSFSIFIIGLTFTKLFNRK